MPADVLAMQGRRARAIGPLREVWVGAARGRDFAGLVEFLVHGIARRVTAGLCETL